MANLKLYFNNNGLRNAFPLSPDDVEISPALRYTSDEVQSHPYLAARLHFSACSLHKAMIDCHLARSALFNVHPVDADIPPYGVLLREHDALIHNWVTAREDHIVHLHAVRDFLLHASLLTRLLFHVDTSSRRKPQRRLDFDVSPDPYETVFNGPSSPFLNAYAQLLDSQ